MPVEILPALRAMTEGWVVKKSPSVPPQALLSEDLNEITSAALATLKERALGLEDAEWGSLERLTSGWIVQRKKGGAPSSFTIDDYRTILRFILEGLTRNPDVAEVQAENLELYLPDTDEKLPDGRFIRDVLREDPFYFAREHLALSL